MTTFGLPEWHSGKETCRRLKRCGFDPWVRKIPWRRKWPPTPVLLLVTPWTAAHQASLSFTITQSWGCHQTISSSVELFSSCCQSFPTSESFLTSQFFTSGGYWTFSFIISPSNEYSGLLSFGIDWFDLLEVQGTLKRLLQHHTSKASIFQRSAFFKRVQLSQLSMNTRKTTVLTRWTFVSKVMSLLFNKLSTFVLQALLRSL